MPNIKSKDYEIKGFLIGSGFDRMFNLPNWIDLVDSFSSFVKGSADRSINDAVAKINIINSMSDSPSRHMQAIKNVANQHFKNMNLVTNFMKNSLNVSNYRYDGELFLKASKVMKITSDLIVSTNTSNVFKEMGIQPEYSSYSMPNGSYYPIHGLFFDENSPKPIMFEEDYLDTENYRIRMSKLTAMLQNISVIHIFGYSLNDLEILTRIKEAKDTDIVYYFCYENEYWKDIIEGQFNSLFGEERITYISKKISDGGYIKNFNELLDNFTNDNEDDDSLMNLFNELEDKNE